MAELARGRMRPRKQDLCRALEGRVTEHHRSLMQQTLALIDCLEQATRQVQARMETGLHP